jgi:hypothetical protein
LPRSLKSIFNRKLNFGYDFIDEGNTALLNQKLVEILVAQFVAWFELAVVRAKLLNGVVCQVDEPVVDLWHVVLFATCAQIAFFVHVAAQELGLLMGCEERKHPNVEFTSVDQQWVQNVLLQNEVGVACLLFQLDFDVRLNRFEWLKNLDTAALICHFTRFIDPYFILVGWCIFTLLWFLFCCCFFVLVWLCVSGGAFLLLRLADGFKLLVGWRLEKVLIEFHYEG